MTKQELNKAVKKLHSEIYRMSFENNTDYFKFIEGKAKEEFKRLHYADNTMQSLTKNSILMMLRMNVRYRFIAFHQFGLFINY